MNNKEKIFRKIIKLIVNEEKMQSISNSMNKANSQKMEKQKKGAESKQTSSNKKLGNVRN